MVTLSIKDKIKVETFFHEKKKKTLTVRHSMANNSGVSIIFWLKFIFIHTFMHMFLLLET